ncbi:MAG: tetratricopeptide repeat protein, partial [Promethearchaeota archaeon]
ISAITSFLCDGGVNDIIEQDKNVRYEYIIQFFRDLVDENLKILDFFDLAKKPNVIHYYLANQMKNGNLVMTTNFDYLIEIAFGLDDPRLAPVISKRDFKKYSDPNRFLASGKLPLFKLHGCKRNIKTGKMTKEWAVTTLDALGKRQEDKIPMIPHYQQELFRKIGKGRTLIVLGYSGGDDLDIMPALRLMSELKKIIWIEHDPFPDKMQWIFMKKLGALEMREKNLVGKERFLQELVNDGVEVYILKINTALLMASLLGKNDDELKVAGSNDASIEKWLSKNFPSPNELERIYNTGILLFDLKKFDLALQFFEKALKFLESSKLKTLILANDDILKYKSAIIEHVGLILEKKGELDDALKYLERANSMHEHRGDKIAMARELGNIGLLQLRKGKFKNALNCFQKSRKFLEREGDLNGISSQLGNIGMVHVKLGNHERALEFFENAYKIANELGDLYKMATLLGNIGVTWKSMGYFQKALEYYQKSFEIHSRLGNRAGVASQLTNMGVVLKNMNKLDAALEKFKKALEIHEKIGDLSGKANDLGSLGVTYNKMGKVEKALEHALASYEVDSHLGNLEGMAIQLGNIGVIYNRMDNLKKALDFFQKAIDIDEQLGDLYDVAIQLGNVGTLYHRLGDFKNALEYFKKACKINRKIGNYHDLAFQKANIGALHVDRGELDLALIHYQDAIILSKKTGNLPALANQLGQIGIIYNKMGKLKKALTYFQKAFTVHQQDENMVGMAIQANNMGMINKKLGNADNALKNYGDFYLLSKKANYSVGITRARESLMTFFESEKKLDEFIENVERQALTKNK